LQDVYEAENLEIADFADCRSFSQDMDRWGRAKWSGGRQLLCLADRGGYVEFEVDLPRAGPYRLDVWFSKAYDYGLVGVTLDARRVGRIYDGFNEKVVPSGKIEYGTFALREGRHRVRFTAVGKNSKSAAHLMGIDCLRLTPVEPPGD
jgi:hypothetical protein